MSLLDAARDARRRPVRSALTVAGIAIGVAALVLLGALSERLTRLVDGGRQFAMGQITVSGAGTNAAVGMMRGSLLTADQMKALSVVPGVMKVAPIVMFPVSDTPAALPFTLAPLVFGCDVDALLLNRRMVRPEVQSGRPHPTPDGSEVVLGSQVARYFDAGTGDVVDIRGQKFTVTGILAPTLTGPDSFVFMPYGTAQSLLVRSEPFLRKMIALPGSKILPIATAAAVFWTDGQDAETVSGRIRAQVRDVSVVSPADASAQLDRALAFVRGMILGSSVAALLIAALTVTNTMFTSVVERRREIGLRRVVGATRRQIMMALINESALLGIAGSNLGLGIGILGVSALNRLSERLGSAIFLVTPRLVAAAIAIPVILAGLAGLTPGWRAASVSPSEAARCE